MSLFDLLRRFFEPGGRRDPFFGGMTMEDDEEEEEDDENIGYPFGGPPRFDFGFSFGPGRSPSNDIFGFDDFFRDFNELFVDFGSMAHRDRGGETPHQRPEPSERRSLRDFMLKYPDSHLPRDQPSSPQGQSADDMTRPPSRTPRGNYTWQEDRQVHVPYGIPRQDQDLDSEVSSRGLDTILRPSEPKSSSFFQSVSVIKVLRPDGTTEERRTVCDGEGNKTTTVTVRRGNEILSGETLGSEQPSGSSSSPDTRQPPDLSDSQTTLSRILHKWFSLR
ncbi:hypothetical protein GDO86_019459 [Hymenochirus boettgeri]|uniref:HCLS1-associated protein X-1 n=1 Tax=Hymenochirus boettgeri TaxID=247094 RepID=A0A8T2IGV6_9PIPI|nr:hypothetical protein GDO86_019459 [Hymenochirus boettgeri]